MGTEEVLSLILEETRAIHQKMDALRTELIARQDAHSDSDSREFRSVRDGLGELRDRIIKLEPVSDTVENHGERLLNLEGERERRLGGQQERVRFAGWVQWFVMALIGACAAMAGWIARGDAHY